MTKKIQISESKLYEIIKQVLIEREEDNIRQINAKGFELFKVVDENFERKTIRIAGEDSPIWEPLYNFLKQIFSQKYKKAANGFMWYQTDKVDGKILNMYRQGITRKYIHLDDEGNPYELEMENYDEVKKIKKISFEQAYIKLYKNLIDMVSEACKHGNCELPDDVILMPYSKYSVLRDEMLKKLGYNVFSYKEKGDEDKFKDILKEEKEKKKEITFSESSFKLFILSSKSNQFINKLNSEYEKVIVNGSLDLDDTSIKSLPDNLYVEGFLWLRNCKNLTSLPDNLEVFGHLDLRGTNIKSLPMTLTVKQGLIWIDDTPLNYNEELLQKYDNFPFYRY